jgi:hypothetical protein
MHSCYQFSLLGAHSVFHIPSNVGSAVLYSSSVTCHALAQYNTMDLQLMLPVRPPDCNFKCELSTV